MTSHAGSSLGCQLQSRTVSNGKQRTPTSTCSRVLYNEMKQNSHWYFPSPENPKEKDHKFLFYFLFWFIIWDVYLIYKVSSIWSNSNLPIPPPNFHFLSKKKNCFRLRSIAYLLNHSYWSDMLVQRKVKSMKRQDMKLIYWETDAGDPRILLRHNPHKMSDITCGN